MASDENAQLRLCQETCQNDTRHVIDEDRLTIQCYGTMYSFRYPSTIQLTIQAGIHSIQYSPMVSSACRSLSCFLCVLCPLEKSSEYFLVRLPAALPAGIPTFFPCCF